MGTENNTIIKIEHVSKKYRLGTIGGTTLRDEIHRKAAKLLHKEDPTLMIGQHPVSGNEEFLALKDISLDVNKGEAVGIIGHNGAGKSTLLKLLCRVTAPTEGVISYNGRITSMLEVGTGFHPELTGRENIYLNGAILGMNRKEIDSKIEKIIDFSECRQFIDTPVKRYSSGMKVKLAFSVSAHLDSEIMIMDEVLAVGDMAFQKKCLAKMKEAANKEGRTVLYVSHNMNTIRQLCNRCIVLDHGQLVFSGNVEEAINVYLGDTKIREKHNDFSIREDDPWITANVKINSLDVLNDSNDLKFGNTLRFTLNFDCFDNIDNLSFRLIVLLLDRTAVATSVTKKESFSKGKNYTKAFELDTSQIAPGEYQLEIVAFEPNGSGRQVRHDYVAHAVTFRIYSENQLDNFEWNANAWGMHVLPDTLEIHE